MGVAPDAAEVSKIVTPAVERHPTLPRGDWRLLELGVLVARQVQIFVGEPGSEGCG
jgi:hypothetical protein